MARFCFFNNRRKIFKQEGGEIMLNISPYVRTIIDWEAMNRLIPRVELWEK